MIFLYYNGFMNPEETNYWIVRFGLPILFLEFLGLLAFIFLGMVVYYKAYDEWPMLLLIVIILIAFGFTVFINILIFLYFLLSIIIKFFVFRTTKDAEVDEEEPDLILVVALSWGISLAIGFLASPILTNFYPEKINVIENFHISQLPPGVHLEGNISTGSLTVLWGISYFFFSFMFTLVQIIYNWKKRKN